MERGIFPYGIGKGLLSVMNSFNAGCPWQDTHFVKQVLLVRGTLKPRIIILEKLEKVYAL